MQAVINWRWGAAAGIGLGLLYAASPLLTGALAASAALLAFAGRDLPRPERRRLVAILGAALAVRLALIGAALLRAIPFLNDLSVGALRGDDSYYIGRAIRARDIALGLTDGRYDYFIVYDEYGRTSYLQILTLLQTLFGPAPYGMRAINALLFVTAAYLLFRLARQAYGATTAALGLTAVLFMPSLLVASTSLLKESTYFFVTALLLTVVLAAARNPRWFARIAAIAIAAACLWALDDLRRGALLLSIAGIATAMALRVAFEDAAARSSQRSRWRRSSLLPLGPSPRFTRARLTPLSRLRKPTPATSSRLATPTSCSTRVSTCIRARRRRGRCNLTDAQAARFVIRAARSFLFTPWPWEMMSTKRTGLSS